MIYVEIYTYMYIYIYIYIVYIYIYIYMIYRCRFLEHIRYINEMYKKNLLPGTSTRCNALSIYIEKEVTFSGALTAIKYL